jgi:hypothetical protein
LHSRTANNQDKAGLEIHSKPTASCCLAASTCKTAGYLPKTYEISTGKIVLGGDLCRFIFVLFGEGRIVVIDDGDY